ncbi:MAG: O-methyltransferase [Gammaproteobacteria bacterium]
MYAAIKAASVVRNIEVERSRLLSRTNSLGNTGPDDKGVTVAVACAISKSPKQAALLSSIAGMFAPRYAIELGTNVGISSAYIAPVIDGTLVTLEVSHARLALAREIHGNLGISNVKYVVGLFENTLSGVLENMPAVNFAFIDGHHQYQPTIDYFGRIVSHAEPGAVFVFDDIRLTDGMKKAWSELRADERFGLVVDFWTFGVCVLRADNEPRVVTEPITCY